MKRTLKWESRTCGGVAWEVYHGDALEVLSGFPENRFACAITSPPYYWLRDYGVDGQLGQEASIEAYVKALSDVLDEVKRVLRRDGLLFLNLGDTYYSAKGQPKGKDPKNKARRFGLRAVDTRGLGVPRKTVIGIPWRVALEMIARGWVLRAPIIWKRPGSMPEPTAKDRPWRTHETIFMFSKSQRYHFDRAGLSKEEDIWSFPARPTKTNGHYAAFPQKLVRKCLAVGCTEGGAVLDPFAGSGTVLRVALPLGHPAVGIDLNEGFCNDMVRELRLL